MYSNDKYVSKLLDQYRKHKTLVVAVDFDDTISPYNVNTKEELQPIIDLLRHTIDNLKFRVVIYTARNKRDFYHIIEFCNDNDLGVEGININLIKSHGNDGKIMYNLLLDDKAGLEQAFDILKQVVKIIEEEVNNDARGVDNTLS
jgi:hypothetical protein